MCGRDQDDGFDIASVSGPLFEGAARDPFTSSAFPATDAESRVGRLIARDHRGRGKPVSLDELKRVLGLDERAVKAIIERLRVDHKMRIGARRTPTKR